jgi:kinesin family protein 3/17
MQKKLEDEKKARLETEKQRLDLQEKLRKMEQELMVGGEIASNAAKQEAALRIANQELIAKKETEAILARKMAEKEAEKLDLEEKYSSLNDEVTTKTRKLKKVWSKYQQAKAEITDLEREFVNEKTELLDSVRELTKQLKLKAFVISKFIPPKVSVLLKKQASSHHFLDRYH